MNILEFIRMTNITYIYLFLSSVVLFSLLYMFLYFIPSKNNISNKIVLKNLLESLDLELPEELKHLDNSTTDPQKLS